MDEWLKRMIVVSGSLLLLVIVPMLDQLACSYCGVGPETSMMAKPVSHSEDACFLLDGYECPAKSSSDNDEPIHIHFCTLHSTSIALDSGPIPNIETACTKVTVTQPSYDWIEVTHFFHPPSVA
jgi:hypothetical protein